MAAPNEVNVVVTSTNRVKPGFEAAKRDAEEAGNAVERIWAKHGDNINKHLANIGKVGGGLGAAGGLLGAGSAGLALAGPLGAATAAMGAFGAVAVGEFKKVNTATKTNTAAQQTYNASIASAKATYDKQMAAAEKQLSQAKTAQQRQAALNKEHAAAAQLALAEGKAQDVKDKSTTKLTGSEQQLAKVSQGLGKMWSNLQTAMAPVILSVAQLAVKIAKDFMPLLGPLVQAGASVINSFLKPLDQWIRSPVFKILIATFTSWAGTIAQLAGPAMVKLLNQLLILFVDLMPSGYAILKVLLPALVQMVQQLTPIAVAAAKVVAVVVQWLAKNGLLVPALWGLVAVFIALKLSLLSNPIFLIAAAIVALSLVIIKYHTQIWTFIQRIWNDVKKFVIRIWDDILNFAKQWWPLIFGPAGLIIKYHNQIWQFIQRIWHDILKFFGSIWGKILGVFKGALGWLFGIGKDIINGLWNGLKAIWNGAKGVDGWIGALGGRIFGWFAKAGTWLYNAGKAVLQGLWDGLTFVWNKLTGWIGGIASWIKAHKGPLSLDNQLLYPAGQALMNGLFNGLKAGFGPVGSFVGGIAGWLLGKVKGAGGKLLGGKVVQDTSQFSLGNLAGSVGGGVARWRPQILQALRMLGEPASLLGAVEHRMMQESGGNPTIVNKWDSNWLRGTPSVGLMQVIGPTFRSNAGPFRNTGPFLYGTSVNPLANIYAGLVHAIRAYPGRGLGSVMMQAGGYAAGGPASGWNWVGEHGRELVKLPAGSHVYSNADSMGMGGGGIAAIQLEIAGGGQSQVEQFMLWMIRNLVRVKGGGDVQKAFGGGSR